MEAKAAVLARYGEPLEYRAFPLPPALGPGEALVRVHMAGICGTDVHLWKGELPIPIPVIMGHETVGRLEGLGEGLERDWRGAPLAAGDRVTWASSIVCGECYYCRVKRQPTRCTSRKAYGISYCADVPPHLRGGYAEYIHLRAGTALFRLPESLSTDSVIGAGCALATALHGLEKAPVGPGDTVVVQGAGPVGLAAAAMARQSGASQVIVVGGPAHRLELARDFGASAVVSIEETPDPDARTKLVLEHAPPFGADAVIECVGHPSAVAEGWDLCRDGGAYLVLGQYANAGMVPLNPHTITRKQLRIFGSWGFEPRHVDLALRVLETTGWRDAFARQITHRYPLDRANEALETVRQWRAGKTVLLP